MGEVYRAEDTRLGREVAIKLLPESVAGDSARVARFVQEARTASALNHPAIVTIHDIGVEGNQRFIVMELVDGRSFRDLLQDGPMPEQRIVALGVQIVEGLAKAHAAGIIHRDLKPENLMLTDDSYVKILDFGLAKLLPRLDDDSASQAPTAVGDWTHPGAILGSAGYMAPEQAAGRDVDPRADQFALGIVLYELATGRHPFAQPTKAETMAAIISGRPEPISLLRRDLTTAFVQIMERLLAKDRGKRFATASDLLAALREAQGRPVSETEVPAEIAPRRAPAFLSDEIVRSPAPTAPVFAGRKEELARLDSFLEEMLGGRGSTVFVTGEAGRGKSALIEAFSRTALQRNEELIVARGACNAHTGAGDPYHPFRELLQWLIGDVEAKWAAGSVAREHALRLWHLAPETLQAIADSGADLIETFLPGSVLEDIAASMPPEDRDTVIEMRHRVSDRTATPVGPAPPADLGAQLVRVLTRLSARRPLLLIVDDLHWADAESVSVLFQLGRQAPTHRILLLGAYRPDEIALGRDGERHPLEPVLNELKLAGGEIEVAVGQAGGREFLDELIDSYPNRLDESFRDALFRQTEAHPLFTIELLRGLLDRGSLAKDEAGVWHQTGEIEWTGLPARIEASMAERIGRLPRVQQQILEVAAVEGDPFTAEAIAKVLDLSEREVVRHLSGDLDRRHQLVRVHGMKRPGGRRLSLYGFRHILFQRYLYGRLDDIERALRHEDVGRALQELHGEQTGAAAVGLARHFEEAGLAATAVDYYQEAGRQALRLFSNQQAIGHFRKALALLDSLPEDDERLTRELSVLMALGSALQPALGFSAPEVLEAFSRARELCERIGKKAHVFPALWGLWVFHVVRLNLQTARELGDELLSLAEATEDKGLELQAHHAQWTRQLFDGSLEDALQSCECGIQLYDAGQHHSQTVVFGNHDPGVCARLFRGWSLALMGQIEEALVEADGALDLARQLDHPLTIAYGWFAKVNVRYLRQEAAEVQRAAEGLIEVSTEHDIPLFVAFGKSFLGWALAAQGDIDTGLDLQEAGWGGFEALGGRAFRPLGAVLMADTLLRRAEPDRAMAVLDDLDTLLEEAGTHFIEPEIRRLQAAAHTARAAEAQDPGADLAAARERLRQAFAVARNHRSSLFEKRARADLERLPG